MRQYCGNALSKMVFGCPHCGATTFAIPSRTPALHRSAYCWRRSLLPGTAHCNVGRLAGAIIAPAASDLPPVSHPPKMSTESIRRIQDEWNRRIICPDESSGDMVFGTRTSLSAYHSFLISNFAAILLNATAIFQHDKWSHRSAPDKICDIFLKIAASARS